MSYPLLLVSIAILVLWCEAAVISKPRVRRTLSDFQWWTCEEDGTENIAFLLHRLELSPTPMELPGNITINMTAEAIQEVSNMDMSVEITKLNTFFGDIQIPCLLEMGSCTYRDLCSFVDSEAEFIDQAKALVEAGGAPLECPVHPLNLTVENFPFELPPIPIGLGLAVEGDYRIKIQLLEVDTGIVMGCFEMETGIIEAPEPEEEEEEEEDEECDSWWCW